MPTAAQKEADEQEVDPSSIDAAAFPLGREVG
jgi:hypothetical protein